MVLRIHFLSLIAALQYAQPDIDHSVRCQLPLIVPDHSLEAETGRNLRLHGTQTGQEKTEQSPFTEKSFHFHPIKHVYHSIA